MSFINAIIQNLTDHLKILLRIIAEQALKISELERRLTLDSSISSKPPSSDGLRKKPTPQSLRTESGKKSGGQQGHNGHTLEQVSYPDQLIVHTIHQCPNCQKSLDTVPILSNIKRQVFEIPEPKIHVTEHQVHVKVCVCGLHVQGSFPEDVKAHVQYGQRIQALASYILHQQLIPEKRSSDFFHDVFNLSITPATLVNMAKNLEILLEPWVIKAKEHIRLASVKHLDETGFRIAGHTCWLHVASTTLWTVYRPDKTRKVDSQDNFTGTVVHDHFKSYYKQLTGVKHALCNAHHLRELKALEKIEKEPWAFKMTKFLKDANRCTEPPIEKLLKDYDSIVNEGIVFHESQPALESTFRKRKKHRIGHNLLIRLRDYKADVLRFLTDAEVPFTNNTGEQDLRMMKVKQKISGRFQTFQGAQTFCTLRSFFSSSRKQDQNIFSSIVQILQNAHPTQ